MLSVNEYFDGTVKSIAFNTATMPATVGVMLAGDYTFNTAAKEAVTVVSGAMKIQQADSHDWNIYKSGDTFCVPANSSFKLELTETSAYLCLYG